MDRAWVTCALTDKEATEAIILARSVNRSFSRIKSLALISDTIPKDVREKMGKEFDLVLVLHGDSTQPTWNDFVDKAILYCFDLKFLRSFAYIDCKCLFLQNSDKLLDGSFENIVDEWILNTDDKNGSIVLLKTTSTVTAKQRFQNRANDKTTVTSIWYSGLMGFQDLAQISDLRFASIVYIPSSCFEPSKNAAKIQHTFTQQEVANLRRSLASDQSSQFASISQEPSGFSAQNADALKNSIAVVGMSLRFPGSNNPEEFWKLLEEGRDGIVPLPDHRWNDKVSAARNLAKFRKTKAGFLSCPVGDFDGKFFSLSPKEVSYMDPQQRMTLELVWEALEHACIAPSKLKGTHAGVFGGWWRNDYREILMDAQEYQGKKFLRTYMGNTIANLTSRVSHVLGLTGPCISTESGCSTSMVAVDMAVRALQRNECTSALAFGANLFLHAFSDEEFPTTMVSPDGHCKTYDAKADGFGRAEGCAVLVLKRYTDAVKDNDRIFGLIRGSAVVQEGLSSSIGTPTVAGEALAMQLALQHAGVDPAQVEFVESHGTGTPVGDPLEMAAIARAYGKAGRLPLIVGSVKTNIGHTESCAGIAGIIKTILCMQNECIPKHINFESLNPNVNLDAVPAVLPLEQQPWKRHPNGKPRLAGISSFGITGTNAHLILQEPPAEIPKKIISGKKAHIPLHFLKLSASCEEALEELKLNYKTFLEKSNVEISDILYSANTGRDDMSVRTYAVGSTKEEITASISKGRIGKAKPTQGKICFLFTGQGSQFLGMSKSLYNSHPSFKLNLDFCFDFLKSSFGINLKEVMWGNDIDTLSQTKFSQPAIFCVEYCVLKLWESWGVRPDCVLGHSLGEFAAAVGAGIITVEEALTLVATRSVLIDRLQNGKMLVIKGNQNYVVNLIGKLPATQKDGLDIAAMNSDDQTVVAGTEESVLALKELCKNNKIKSHVLQATHAFHSRMMKPMLQEYMATAVKVNHKEPTCTYVSGMEGVVMKSLTAEYWMSHTTKWVNFLGASSTVLDELGCDVFLEVGPQPILSSFIMENKTSSLSITCLPSLRKSEEEWTTMLTTLGSLYQSNIEIDWEGFHYFSPGNKVTLPYYPFQRKPYPFPENPANDWNPLFHPLVGSTVSNSSDTKIFARTLQLEETTSFLKDHVVGPLLLFPGAGFLEMGIVGGYAGSQCLEGTYQLPQYPICFEDFRIERPLALDERNPNKLQTVVVEKDGTSHVTISSRVILDDDTRKWITHATGTFLPFENLDQDYQNALGASELSEIQNSCNVETQLGKIYNDFAEEGLKFGKTFQTLQRVWKSPAESSRELLCLIKTTCKDTGHLLHPVIIDAMFQASMLVICPENEKPKLSVPVSVKKFIWYKQLTTPECYVHFKNITVNASNSQLCAVLYDSNGDKLAVMIDATLIETSIPTILKSIETQKSDFPSMFEDVWRSQPAPHEHRIPQGILAFREEEIKGYAEEWKQFNNLQGKDKEFYDYANHLYLLQLIASLKEIGFEYDISKKPFTLQEIMPEYKIKQNLSKFVFYILLELQNEGYLKCNDKEISFNSSFTFIKRLPSLEEIHKTSAFIMSQELIQVSTEVKDVTALGSKLSKILKGTESSLSLLFPETQGNETSEMGPAESFYKSSEIHKNAQKLIRSSIPVLFSQTKDYCTEQSSKKPLIRILEVGAGTGSITEDIFPVIPVENSNIEYTYTDISSVFYIHGEKIFENSGVKAIYKTLNIEKDAVSQGFMPNQYDLVIAGSVIHATKDIRKTLRNLNNLVAPQGAIYIFEMCKPSRAVNILFGTLDGYSSYTDTDIRPFHCELALHNWTDALEQSGLSNVNLFPSYNNHVGIIVAHKNAIPKQFVGKQIPCIKSWIGFTRSEDEERIFKSKLEKLDRTLTTLPFVANPNHVESLEKILQQKLNCSESTLEGILFLWGCENNEEKEFNQITQSFLNLCKILAKYSVKAGAPPLKLVVVTSDLQNVADDSFNMPFPSVLIGMAKVLQNENLHLQCKTVDLPGSACTSLDSLTDIVINEMYLNDEEFSVAYRGTSRLVKRLTALKDSNLTKHLQIPKCKRFQLVLPTSKTIDDLRFAPAPSLTLEDYEVEVRVVAYSLNFRDVLIVLKPSEVFEKLTSIGFDYSGVVSRVGSKVTKYKEGEAVVGLNVHGETLASHVRSHEDFLMKLSPSLTFAEGATLPVVAATVYACLVKTAKITKDDTILIHTGSGGVGLAAIQLAKHVGCRIVATAGSERKRSYLRRLGVQFVYNSRNTEYLDEIRRDVGGVDVVLNSLTSPGFKEATLASCNNGARFVEMSKLNVWSKEEVLTLRPDVQYDLIDISTPSHEDVVEFMSVTEQLQSQNLIQPLPHVRFEAADIREALSYMQKAKHIGKIICCMPQPDGKNGWVAKYFNDRSSYVITGGLGGIGMEFAKWMIKNGAQNVVLTGRNPPNAAAEKEISQINLKGSKVNVTFIQCDVSDVDQCKNLLETIKSSGLPQLRGIMHAAGVLSDASLENQTWEKFQETFRPKVHGGWNLHQLTLNYPLEHFVMFSSVASSFGSPGQSNHCAANTFLDFLAFHRHTLGLPSTTVNWGQWGQVGVAANKDVIGIKPMTTLQCFLAFEASLRNHNLQSLISETDFELIRNYFGHIKTYVEEVKVASQSGQARICIDGTAFWKEFDAAETISDKQEVIKRCLKVIIKEVLRLPQDENIENEAKFQEMGMDSLMMIEMKNMIQTLLGDRVQVSNAAVKDCNTVNELGAKLVEILCGSDESSEVANQLTREELNLLLREDSKLPEDIQANSEIIKACLPSEIETILITGCTGNLGPYVLKELCKRKNLTKIYCLMRPHSKLTPEDRIATVIKDKKLTKEVNLELLECVEGDASKDLMGMKPSVYEELAGNVDAIINLSVKAAIQERYCKAVGDQVNSRSVNVNGTIHALKFASHKKLKHVYHGSTLMTAIAVDENNFLKEDFHELSEFDEYPDNAYVMSKFVADNLVSEGIRRGIPCKIFRFPFLGGDTINRGNTDLVGNHLVFRMMAYMHLGKMPPTPLPFTILPVGQAAEIASSIFFNNNAGYEMYNVGNPLANEETEIPNISKEFGYEIEIVDEQEFVESVENAASSDILDLVKATTRRTDFFQSLAESPPPVVIGWAQNKNVFWSRKLEKLVPNYPKCFETSIELLKKDLRCAKNSGIFARAGLS